VNGRKGLTPEQEAWLRDPRHPIHNGLLLDPEPNLIMIREGHPNAGRRQLRMSNWARRHIMWPHLTRLQRVLFWSGLAALVLMFIAAPLIIGPIQCDNLSGRTVCHSE
jgi:hypothetical protein